MTEGLREKGKNRRRHEILQAARALIMSEGIEGVSMRRIAEWANLSPGTLYNLYGSKEEILYALLNESLDRVDATLPSLKAKDGVALLRSALLAAVGELRAKRELFRPLVAAIDTLAFFNDKAATMERFEQMATAALGWGVDQRLLTDDLDRKILARHLFLHFVHAARNWASGALSDERFEGLVLYGLYLTLAAAATPTARVQFVRELRRHEGNLRPVGAARQARAK
jgi:AcrR family transcriptional regulator